MPQLTLKHCCIADVLIDPEPKMGGGKNNDKIVKINVDEEDFFTMLDSVNPKNIVKYLDMRKIKHRDALEINIKPLDNVLPKKHTYSKTMRALIRVNKTNNKKASRAMELMKAYKQQEKI